MNTFFLLSLISAVALIVLPVYLVRRFRKSWKMQKGVFLHAGLCLLVIEIFHYSVMSQALSMWPDFENLPFIVKAAFLGLAAGLFFELGRFMMLDKFFRSIRSLREGVYFGLGWNGVETFIVGVLLIFGVVGINMLITTSDVSTLYPDADKTQIETLQQFRSDAITVINEQPYTALDPILERLALTLMDIALTLIILYGFAQGTNVYTWYSVLFHGVFVGSVFAAQQFDPLWGELLYVVFAAIAYGVIRQIKKSYPEHVLRHVEEE